MRQSWKKFRYQLEYIGLRLIAGFIPMLPRRVCASLARGIGWLAYAFDKRGRRVALANLEVVFGERFSAADRNRIALESYRNFARAELDLLWAPRLTRENLSRYVEIRGGDLIASALAGKRVGPIILSAHFGSFEWGALAVAGLGHPGSLVAEDFKNPKLSAVFSRLRAALGSDVVPQERSILRLLKNIKRGRSSGMLADLSMPLDQPAVILQTFGLKMRATLLHAVIAQRTGSPIMPYCGIPNRDGTMVLELYPPIEVPSGATPAEIAQRCWNFFERQISDRPELWLWAYKHWRYRPSDATRPYPFYANISSQFDRELAEIKAVSAPLAS